MKVNAQELWRAVKNATLYAKEKTWNGGEAEVKTEAGAVVLTASDDFVTVTTSAPASGVEVDHDYYISAKDLKAWERGLRDQEGEVTLPELAMEPAEPEWWEALDDIFGLLGQSTVGVGRWELNPERLTLLSRLEPKGEYPLSWKPFQAEDRWFWGLKYGPRTRGIVVPLDRENLDLEDAEEALWP